MKKFVLWIASASLLVAGDWSAPVDVLHELKPVVTYRAKLEGDLLVVKAHVQPGWHTFVMDNERRAAEKRAGKPSLGIDQPTQFKFDNALTLVGPWRQSPPKDFSKPELRWYSWGFEKEAVFAARVKTNSGGAATIGIRGQACSDTTCKNIDVSLAVPIGGSAASGAKLDLQGLVEVH